MSSWTASGGPNIMPQQWFWYGASSTGFNQSALQSVDTLGTPSVTFDPANPNFAEIIYSSGLLTADMNLSIADGTPSALSEQVTWTNTSGSTMYLTIFDYFHFQFSPNGDTLSISGNSASQGGAGGSADIGVAPFLTGFVGYEAGVYSSILSALTNSSTSAGFNVNKQGSASGNTEGVFEWQIVLPANSSYTLSINESADSTAPEPGSAALMALTFMGSAGVWLWRRKRIA